MAFESLSERLNGVFKKLRGKGKLSEADIKAAMREVRMALQCFSIGLGNGTYDGCFFLLTITYYYHLTQCIIIGQGNL